MKWLDLARAEMGVTEDLSDGSNPRILDYAKAAGYTPTKGDGDPWCANFVSFVMAEAGYALPAQSWRARSWAEWGREVKPQRGAVAVVPRGKSPKQGHVFLIDRVDGQWVYGLGGNQNDSVSIAKFRKDRLVACRWPQEAAAPIVAKTETIGKTAASSKTITGVLIGWLGLLVTYLENGVQVAMDAAAKMAEWSPAQSMFYTLGVNAKVVGIVMIGTGLSLAMWRRFGAALSAKEG
jgi:uncharacterized protein (TIGR02594 family)